MTHALGYCTPAPGIRRREPSPWLVAGAIVAVTCYFFFLLAFKTGMFYRGSTQQARAAAANADLASYSTAVDMFANDTGRYPTDAEALAALASPPGALPGWKGPYITQLKRDPWGHPYVYHTGGPQGGPGYRILSVGPDGREGTGDDLVSATDATPAASTVPATRPAVTEP